MGLIIDGTLIPTATLRDMALTCLDGDALAGVIAARYPTLAFTHADHLAVIRWYWEFI